jgi:hypothetical protein
MHALINASQHTFFIKGTLLQDVKMYKLYDVHINKFNMIDISSPVNTIMLRVTSPNKNRHQKQRGIIEFVRNLKSCVMQYMEHHTCIFIH